MSVANAWDKLLRVLGGVAPATAGSFLPPVSGEKILAAEAATGLLWPDELRAFYAMHDGQRLVGNYADPYGGQLLPSMDLFGLDHVLSERALMIEIWHGITQDDPEYFTGGYDGLLAEYPEAGSEVGGFLREYIPLAGQNGNFYFCDVRPGRHHGCVRSYIHGAADSGGPLWDSISTMLDALQRSIEEKTEFEHSVWRVTDGHLWWRPPLALNLIPRMSKALPPRSPSRVARMRPQLVAPASLGTQSRSIIAARRGAGLRTPRPRQW